MILDYLLDDSQRANVGYRVFRVALFAVFLILGLRFIFCGDPLEDHLVMRSFWHQVNTPFHEAGHVVFGIFGQFIGSLGGSLGQLLMPAICLVALLVKTRDPFGAAVSLWWLAENFMDLAPYISDARDLTLPLLGDNVGSDAPYGFHDWNYLLTETRLLPHDHLIAGLAYGAGRILMATALVWAGWVLWRSFAPPKPQRSKTGGFFDL